MKIVYITAGTAGMYCGSCIRDNALAAELLALGHDVTLLPLYTPTRTDEPNVSENLVFFGGISCYLEQHVPLFRRTPRLLDRLWDSPTLLNAVSRLFISTDPHLLAEMTVSVLRGEGGYQAKEVHKLCDWLAGQPTPDIVNLHDSMLVGLAPAIKRRLGCPVVCTLQGEDLFLEELGEPHRSQALELIRSQIGWADGFIAVSEYYAEFMASYLRVPREKIFVVPLGVNLAGFEMGPRGDKKSFTIGHLARVTPEKGLDRLCQAYWRLRRDYGLPPSRLEVAGYLAPEHKPFLQRLRRQMEDWGLGNEFHYRGVLSREEKIRFLQGVDVFSVPSVYAEPKGLYLLEAMACGIPVVQPRVGAFPEILAATGGGVLVDPNSDSLARGILSLWNNRAYAAELGRKGAEAVRQQYGVRQEAQRALEVYASVIEAGKKGEMVFVQS